MSLGHQQSRWSGAVKVTVSPILRSLASLQSRDLLAYWAVWFFTRLGQPGGTPRNGLWPRLGILQIRFCCCCSWFYCCW